MVSVWSYLWLNGPYLVVTWSLHGLCLVLMISQLGLYVHYVVPTWLLYILPVPNIVHTLSWSQSDAYLIYTWSIPGPFVVPTWSMLVLLGPFMVPMCSLRTLHGLFSL